MPSLRRPDAGFYRCAVRNRMGALLQRRSEVQVACTCARDDPRRHVARARGGCRPVTSKRRRAESPSRILWETTTAQVGGPSVRLAGAAAPRVTKGWRGQCRCPRSAERGPGTRRLLRHELLAAPSPFPTESDVRNVNQTPSICSRSSPTTVCAETLSLHSKKDVGGDIPDGIQAAEVQFTLCWADPLWGLRQLPRGRDTASQCSVWGHGTGMLAQAGRSMRV